MAPTYRSGELASRVLFVLLLECVSFDEMGECGSQVMDVVGDDVGGSSFLPL